MFLIQYSSTTQEITVDDCHEDWLEQNGYDSQPCLIFVEQKHEYFIFSGTEKFAIYLRSPAGAFLYHDIPTLGDATELFNTLKAIYNPVSVK
ncbi:hypothetical protein BZZ01_07415 [Nostocales cyanobacterium HT-58-2]|nr:hypothetical protein BZZ01_07415 [Nostocales cyanobacterium HT-58-2]